MSKSTKSSENGVCMFSRVNISYMCLNTSRSYWNVCVGCRHENGGALSEGFFLYDTVVHVLMGFKRVKLPPPTCDFTITA